MTRVVPALFDVNAGIGKSCTGAPDCATLRDRLAHMDRLGIARAVVWDTASRTDNATTANARLRAEWERLPAGGRGRLAPAFTISPLLAFERGGRDALERNLRACRTRCLRFTAGLTKFRLSQLEPLWDGLRDLRPVLVMNNAETDARDILEFTEKHPAISLVLCDVIWGRCLHVMDLMRRRPNILVEISQIHTWDGIELLARHGGSHRVLFGAGPRTFNGAAIAALAQADLGASDRERIAHGNLDRLLDLRTDPLPDSAAGPRGGRRLWQRLLNRRPLGVDVVDAHVHLGSTGGYVIEENDPRRQIDLALAAMRRLGIRSMIASGMQALMASPVEGNDRLGKLLAPHAGRLRGYAAFNPFYADDLLPRLDRYFSGKVFVGFKLLCDYWRVPVTDPRFEPMWTYANRRRLPVLIHTWDGRCNSPAMLKDPVERYPDIAFILGHAGGGTGGRAEAEALAAEHPNVYLEWCGSFCAATPWEDTLKKVSPRQVLFGSDAVLHSIPWELGRLLSLDVPDATLVPILGANMRRILSGRRLIPTSRRVGTRNGALRNRHPERVEGSFS